jgi:hypothetical protein
LAQVGVAIADNVAEKIVNDVRGQSGRVAPVFLQVWMDTLWKRLPPDVQVISDEHLTHAGGITDVLAAYVNSAIDQAARAAPMPAARVRRWLLDRFVTKSGARVQVLRRSLEDSGIPETVVDVLRDARVLRIERRRDDMWLELSHDMLASAILRNR